MKQSIVFFLIILNPFFAFTQFIETNSEEWSGRATFIRHTFSETDGSKSEVIYRIDIAFTKGRGSATASYSVDRRVASKGGLYTESGSTTQSEPTELSLSFSGDGKHYSVAMAVPACSGTLQINDNGNIYHRDFGMDETNFMLEDKEVGKDVQVLQGEESNIIKSEGGSSKETYSWFFSRKTMLPDLLVISPDYETWMPEPYNHENDFGASIAVGLLLQRKDGKPLDIKAKEFFVQLLETSREPGISINYPTNALNKGEYDMKLATEKVVNAPYFEGQKFTIPCLDGESGGFIILAYDGGAYTTLEVKAIMEDGTEIKGHYGKADGPTSIPYPFRDRGRKIAKVWLEANANPNETDDNEVTPGNNNKGDGLTAYEEYRGVITADGFKRLDPSKKELGIKMKKDDLPLFKKGIALFETITGITPIICNPDQMDDLRILNRNSIAHRFGSQHGLYLKTKNLGNEKGEILPAADFKTTRNSDQININTIGIMKMYDSVVSVKKLPYTAEEDLNWTVAHYLCQAVSVLPHGASGKGEIVNTANNSGLTIQYLLEDGKPASSIPALLPQWVGGQGNDASGDAGCIMCMNNKYTWSYAKNGASIIYRKVPPLVPGKKLCASPLGTLINANGKYFGNAQSARGNCISHIKVKSW